MYQRADGELFKVLKLENGFVVSVWDPELPPAVLGQPCSQQPIRWWRHFTFSTREDAAVFINTFLENA